MNAEIATPGWLDRSEYPFESRYLTVNGHQLHFIDEGSGEILLFVHGTPSWSFEFRHIIRRLRSAFRCVAVDHIGFGLSDKPADYDYSTLNHSKTLEIFIREKQLENITLVVHDFGGPIGLSMAIRHPEWIRKLVIMNSWLWSSKTDPEFIRLRRVLKNPLMPFLYRYLNLSARFVLPRSFGDKKLSRKSHRHYIRPFNGNNQRNGPAAFIRSLLDDQDWFEQLWNQKSVISDKPALFIWGMKDPVIKPQFLDKFASGFPNHRILRLDTAGHFPQEEQPEETANAISEFMKGG